MSQIRGRFDKPADELMTEYTTSLPYDWRLYRQDINGSIAHARMLAKQGIISDKEAKKIVRGLESIRKEIKNKKFKFRNEDEDIHMAVEKRLIEKTGDVGRKLHTARSRNDQVALDTRLFVKESVTNTIAGIKSLQKALLDVAEANIDVIIPGYTHLQAAQPVLLSHYLLAYFEMFQRDVERLNDCLKRVDVMPLGSGALAGVAYKVDREFLAKELGFSQVSKNSLDAVSDRDFVLEYEFDAGVCMMHLSRLAEEIILWSTAEFDFVEVDDAYATSSSMMPQKKNPDVAELARGKVGRVYGSLMAMLTTMKSMPLAYNRDMQEDKEGLFDACHTLLSTLKVFEGMISTLKVKADNTKKAVERGYILATDLADYLVKKGESFRNAYDIVARLVNHAVKNGKSFSELKLDVYKKHSPLFDEDVEEITIESSLASKDVPGGTAPRRVKQALAAARKTVAKG